MPKKAPRLLKPVVLVGMMGSGKTTIGMALAKMLDVEFLDTDQALTQAAQMTIAEIFDRDGEAFFRKRETEVLERLLTGAPAILSTGGGAFMSETNREIISRHGLAVWLNADLELLWSRVKHKTTRPLLRTDDPKKTLQEIFEVRDPVYRLADLSVEAHEDYSIEDMASVVFDALVHAGHVKEPFENA